MQNFNYFFFLMSITCVEIVYGMEKKLAKNQEKFIELNHKYIVSHITKENINYFSEYGATLQDNGIVSFSLGSFMFLPIQKQGTKRFFVAPSMIKKRMSCEAFMVRKRTITSIASVHGITESKDREIYIYMGFNNKAFKSNDNGWTNRVFTACIMGIEIQEKKTKNHHFWYFHDSIPRQVIHLNKDIYIKKHAANKECRD